MVQGAATKELAMQNESDSPGPLDGIEALLVGMCEATPEAEWPEAVEALCRAHPADAAAIRQRYGWLRDVEPVVPPPGMPKSIAGYRLLRRLGAGGMGIVFLATQESTGRQVVLKWIRPELLGSQHARERFQREVATAAGLDHPGICAVYEAGEADGSPFLVMRYVPGETLAVQIEHRRSTATSRGSSTEARDHVTTAIQLVESLARAVHVAHEAGLVHRDIKPANVMVQPDGQPVLLDFGLARSVDSEAQLTMTGEVVGTPAYMSPEQIGSTQSIDRRSDVYALGVTLYELLTGRLPFAAPTRDALYREILDGNAERPSRSNRAVTSDLETVVATAMTRDRDRRYATALDFAEDLRRVRRLEPIAAKPAGWLLRLRRWSQRNPVAATLTTSLSAALVVSLWLLVRGDQALAESRVHQLVLESRRMASVDPKLALYLASEARAGADDEETLSRMASAIGDDRERARLSLPRRFQAAWRDCFGPDGETVWFAGADANGQKLDQLFRWRRGEGLTNVPTLPGAVTDFDVSPDDGAVAIACAGAAIHLVAPGGGPGVAYQDGPGDVIKLRFLDGRRLLTGGADGTVQVVDLDNHTSRVLARLDHPVTAVFVSAGRTTAALGSAKGQLQVLTIANLTTRALAPLGECIDRLWVAEDGTVAVRTTDWRLRIFDATGAPVPLPKADGSTAETLGDARDPMTQFAMTQVAMNQVGLSSTTPSLITGHADQLIRIRDLSGSGVGTLSGHAGWVFALDVSPDGRRLASGAGDGGIAVWDLPGRRQQQVFRDIGQPRIVRFFPSGDRLLVASDRGPVRVYQLDDPVLPERFEHRTGVRFCRAWPVASGNGLITADASGGLVTWNGDVGLRAQNGDAAGLIQACAVAGDGSCSAVFCSGDRTLRLFDRDLHLVVPPQRWPDHMGRNMILAVGDGCVLAASGFAGERQWRYRHWSTTGGLVEAPLPAGLPPAAESWAIQFSPDGKELLVGGADGNVRLLDWSDAARPPPLVSARQRETAP
jgi:eukaryotic-like serine/threonine-protein kinase